MGYQLEYYEKNLISTTVLTACLFAYSVYYIYESWRIRDVCVKGFWMIYEHKMNGGKYKKYNIYELSKLLK